MQLAEIEIKDLLEFDAIHSVLFFKKLLHCEVHRLDLPATSVIISENTNEPDDGIDASFVYHNERSKIIEDGILKNKSISFQIKADNKFRNLSESSLISEFFNITKSNYEKIENSPEKLRSRLKKGILSALEKKQYYILVSFRTEFTPEKKDEKIKFIKKLFKNCGFDNADVDIFDVNTLQIAFNQYPSIVLPFKNKNYILPINEVLKKGEFNNTFKNSQKYVGVKNELDAFISDKNAYSFRLIGEPGIGKTRTLLELCKEKDNIIYFEDPKSFSDSGLYDYLSTHHEESKNYLDIIVIVDECDFESFKNICSKLYRFKNTVKFISVYQEKDESTSSYCPIICEAPKLTDDDIKSILFEYNLSHADAERIAQFIGGYPSFAHFIGESYLRDGILLRNEQSIFESFIAKSKDKDEKRYIKTVLMYLSVFKRFVFEGEENFEEKKYLCDFIRKSLPKLTDEYIEEVIKGLKLNKIIQNQFVHYISPKLLHVWLYREFWQNESRIGYLDDVISTCPIRLKKWFYEMFVYAKTASIPCKIPQRFLSSYEFKDFLETNKIDFFFNLTVADPVFSLSRIQSILGSVEDRLLLKLMSSNYNYNYRVFIQSLSVIATDSSLFEECITLIYRFALMENGESLNPLASKLYIQLFQIYVPGTELSLNERLRILKYHLKNCKSRNGIILITKTLIHALDLSKCSRIESSYPVAGKIIRDYYPSSSELSLYINSIVSCLIYECVSRYDVNDNADLLKEIFSSLEMTAVYFPDKVECVLVCIRNIIALDQLKPEVLHKILADILNHLSFFEPSHYPHLPQFINQLNCVKNQVLVLSKNIDFYFNKNIYDGPVTDNYEERFITDIHSVFSSLRIEEQHKYLKRFVCDSFNNEYYFGVMIARFYFDLEPIDNYIKYYLISNNQDNYFLAGFIAESFFCKSSVKKINCESYERVIDSLVSAHLNDLLLILLVHSGVTVYLINKILELVFDGTIELVKIESIVGPLSQASPEQLNQLMRFTLKNKSSLTIKNIINVIYHIMRRDNVLKLNSDLVAECIISAIISQNNKTFTVVNNFYDWFECIHRYLAICENNVNLSNNSIKKVLDCFLLFISNSGYGLSYDHSVNNLLWHFANCFKEKKEVFWFFLVKYLQNSIVITNPIKNWLKGEVLSVSNDKNPTPGLYYFSLDFLYSWIHDDFEKKLRLFALCCPKDLFVTEKSYMREIISKYGNTAGLFEIIISNLNSGYYVGLISDSVRDVINQIDEQIHREDICLNLKKFLIIYKEKLERNYSILRKTEEENGFV